MRKYGLIGFPLSHSFSVGYFKEKFLREGIEDTVYENFPIENIELFPELIEQNPELSGLNVTIPYKELVIPFLHKIDPTAREINAVNTIKILRKDKKTYLKGFNTDITGFGNSLKPFLRNDIRKALILGTGGASKAIKYVLNNLNISYKVLSRTPGNDKIGYREIDEDIVKSHLLIINCTPLGTFPDIQKFPDIPYHHLTDKHVLYDLVYNPDETLFLKKGKEKGASIKNGLEMLQIQAEAAWDIWTDL